MRAWSLVAVSLWSLLSLACGDDSTCEATCGDGVRTCEETCDDGNLVDGDGCSSTCELESGPCPDADQDGYRDQRCGGDDCDDANPDVNPGATEVSCNGLDDDCSAATSDLEDADEDGVHCDLDCDDSDPEVHPGVEEIACNEKDDDCSPASPDVVDADEDGFDCRLDCEDARATINPDQTEVCGNGFDDDCDGATDCEDAACADLPICRARRGGASGGQHRGRITVLVFDRHTELPVEDLEVLLESRGQLVGGRTSTAGEARFTDVPTGPYTITVRSDGWRTVSLVGTRAARIELPVEALSVPTSEQTLGVEDLDVSWVGRRGILFGAGQAPREVLVREAEGRPVIDGLPETEPVDAPRLELPTGAPASVGLRLDDEEASRSAFGFASLKEVPEPSLQLGLSEEPLRAVEGTVEARDFDLVGGTLTLSAFVHAGVFGDVPGVIRTTRATIQSATLARFERALESNLWVVTPPELSEVTLTARFETASGFARVYSERRVRRAAVDLDTPVHFEDLRPPPAWVAIDQSAAGRPSFGWDTASGPGPGEGLYELRLYEEDGSLLRRVWVVGGADGVSLPLGASLESLSRLTVEVLAHVVPGLDLDAFRWAELDRATTHVLSRRLPVDP